jgi:hypothetical protein
MAAPTSPLGRKIEDFIVHRNTNSGICGTSGEHGVCVDERLKEHDFRMMILTVPEP